MFVWMLEGRQLCLFSNFFFLQKKLRKKEEILEREGKTERHSSSSPFETLYSSNHFMAMIVN